MIFIDILICCTIKEDIEKDHMEKYVHLFSAVP